MSAGKALSRLAEYLYRSPREASLIASRGFVIKSGLLLASLTAMALVLFVPPLGSIVKQWRSAVFAVPVARSTWRAYFGAGESCLRDAREADCPVNPAFAGWRDAPTKADTDYRSRVRSMGTKTFWLRADIGNDILKKAYDVGASVLYLGGIRADFSLWVDDVFYYSNSSKVYQQIVIPIPPVRLVDGKPLPVVFRITDDIMHSHPDLLGGLKGEGFMTPDDAATYSLVNEYDLRVPSLLFAVANFILSTIFFGLWIISPKRPEYFYVCLYSTANAFLSCLLVDTLVVALTPLGSARAYTIMLSFKAASTLLLSFAFARVRPALSAVVLFVAAALAGCLFFYFNATELILFSYGQIQWIIPITAALGALICLHQAIYLTSVEGPRIWHEMRVKRLLAFSASFGAVFFVASAAIIFEPSSVKWNIYYRVSDLVLLYVVGAIVFSEYRDRERQLESAPGSEYHKRAVMPDRVAGAILTVDLKNSEPFYRSRAMAASDVQAIVQWRSHMNAAILRFSGCVIRNKGDEITVLFDELKVRQPAVAAMRAAKEISEASSRLETEFRLQGLLPKGVAGLKCRIAVVEGEIRPIFEKHEATLEPQWEEAGSSTPLLALARLLEMEKSVAGSEESTLVMFESLAAANEAPIATLNGGGRTRQRCKDKHGAEHELAVLSLEHASGENAAAA
jgi:hypothetical protein